MNDQPMNQEVTSDDKLWVLLAYILAPIVPIIILLMDDKKDRPYIKAHNAQALILGIILVLLGILIGWTVFLSCVPFLFWLLMIYYGIQGYQGKFVKIPVITDFVQRQGWA